MKWEELPHAWVNIQVPDLTVISVHVELEDAEPWQISIAIDITKVKLLCYQESYWNYSYSIDSPSTILEIIVIEFKCAEIKKKCANIELRRNQARWGQKSLQGCHSDAQIPALQEGALFLLQKGFGKHHTLKL